mgnify:CR=1 FL=1
MTMIRDIPEKASIEFIERHIEDDTMEGDRS